MSTTLTQIEMKNVLAPKLRFKGYSKGWENRALNSLSTKISDGLHSTPIYDENGEYYFVNGNNLINGEIYFAENTKRVGKEEYNKHRKDLSDRTILISINGTIGSLALYNNEKVILGKSACYININSSTDKHFIYYSLQTPKIKNKFNAELTGSTIKNLSLTTIKNCEFGIPTLPEQQKIASFLSAVDEKIQELTRKKELLTVYKKGVMQQLFSGKLRFKDENGKAFPKWEEKSLAEVKNLEQGDGDWILSENIGKKEKYSIIQLGNIGLGKFIDREMKTLSEIDFKKIKGTLIKSGDLLINRMVDDEKLNACIFKYFGNYVTSVDVCWIRHGDGINNIFLMYLLTTRVNQKKLLSLSSGSGRVRISKKNFFEKFIFKLPSIQEQQKIANYLSNIDSKIEIVNNQISQTQIFKKGLLQQMFV